jgi:hypothetical protein
MHASDVITSLGVVTTLLLMITVIIIQTKSSS